MNFPSYLSGSETMRPPHSIDPALRRTAVSAQVLCGAMGAYILARVALGIYHRGTFSLGHLYNTGLVGVMWGGALLLRRGLCRRGAAVVIAASICLVGLNVFVPGLSAGHECLRWAVVPLAIGALFLGPPGVWGSLAGVLFIFCGALARDAGYLGGAGGMQLPELPHGHFGISLLLLLAMPLVLLRLGSEMHRSMEAALARRAEMERAFEELRGAHAALEQEVEKRRQAEAALARSQRLEALGRLSSGVAHDFNNLLTVIFASLNGIEEELPPNGTGREDAAALRSAASRATGLTRQLLAFARHQVSEPRAVDPHRLVQNLAPMLRRLVGEQVDLAIRVDERAWMVWMDPVQLEQVILNLVVNARDAMPQGGRLTIFTTGELLEGAAAEVIGVSPGEYICLAVQDTGTGMEPGVADQAFEPFFTTKEPGRGTGLGLATVYGVVSGAGGGIGVSTATGKGTTMRVYLPRGHVGTGSIHLAAAGNCTTSKGETVLLVEDEPMVRALSARALRREGYEVLEAASAEEALQVARGNGYVRLLVTDVMLPGMHGGQLAKELQGQRPGLPVLYMSGYPASLVTERGLDSQAVDLLMKPYQPAELVTRVRAALSGLPPGRSRANDEAA